MDEVRVESEEQSDELTTTSVLEIRRTTVFFASLVAVAFSSLSLSLNLTLTPLTPLNPTSQVSESNLSRQLLFIPSSVGLNKASAAASSLSGWTSVSAVPQDVRRFENWMDIDVCFPCVDSVAARKYVDGECVRRGIPSVHCGTEGAAASVQAVARGMEPYGKAVDVETKKVPVCTVKEVSVERNATACASYATPFLMPVDTTPSRSSHTRPSTWCSG